MESSIYKQVKDATIAISGPWAIEKSALQAIKATYSEFKDEPKAFLSGIENGEDEEILSINGDVATIDILGPLVDVHTCASKFFGTTSYEEIREALTSALENKNVEKIVFNMDSPGGMVAGCDITALAIKKSSKPTEAKVVNMAASAAYWIASQCDTITAQSETTSFGSIGVVIEYWDNERRMQTAGYDLVSITSTGAPDKRVDPKTEEGERKVRSELDDLETIFMERVAEGRRVTPSVVLDQFGKGGMFLAKKSLQVKMIDSIEFSNNNIINSNKTESISTEDRVPESLKEFLERNPNAQVQMDEQIQTQVSEALKKQAQEKKPEEAEPVTEPSKKVSEDDIALATKYIKADYPSKIKELALDVIQGKESASALNIAVGAVDEIKEANASAAASDETDTIGETSTPPSSEATEAEDAYQASVKQTRQYTN